MIPSTSPHHYYTAMSRPPHSSAYPDMGTSVPPFPQLIYNNQQTQQHRQEDRRTSLPYPTPIQIHQGNRQSQPHLPGPNFPIKIGSAVPESPDDMEGDGDEEMYGSGYDDDRHHDPSSSGGGMQPASGPSRTQGGPGSGHGGTPYGKKNGEGGKDGSGGKKDGSGGGGGGDRAILTGGTKGRKPILACSRCRIRKSKCDKRFPCGPCIARNEQSLCREVEKHTPASAGCATSQDLLNVQQRLAALESLLAQAGVLAPGQLDIILNGKGKLTLVSLDHTLPNGASSRTAGQGITHNGMSRPTASGEVVEEQEGESDTEGAALTLEHLAFGQRKTQQRRDSVQPGLGAGGATLPNNPGSADLRRNTIDPLGAIRPDFRESNTSSYGDVTANQGFYLEQMKQDPGHPNAGSVPKELLPSKPLNLKKNLTGPVRSDVLEALDPTEIFSLFYQRNDIFVKALLSVLPDRTRGEVLVKAYLERVEWLHRCLHVPTFLKQCEELWNTPIERVVTDVYTPFLSLYIVVLCLGLHFMDSLEASAYFTAEEQATLPDIWLSATRGSLWMSDFMAVHTIESLQTIILMGVFMNNQDRADAAWSLLGAAIKMAQGMGLSRLGGEAEPKPGAEHPKWKSPWESVVKREVGRRLWWNLVFLDWSLAPSYNFASSIQPDQIKTALPANVEDEDIIDGQPLRPQPISTRTGMSYHLARIRFAEISQRQIWQANASPHPPYSFILGVDTELRKAISDLPPFFSIDLDVPESTPTDHKSRVFHWERIIINLSGQSRLMRLHRPWLSRGYKDKKYEYSRDQCIRAARSCLRLMQDEDGTATYLEKWWIPLFYVTVAGVVVLIDLLRTPKQEINSDIWGIKYSEVVGAINQIRQVENVSHAARGSIKVLEQLLSEVDAAKNGSMDPGLTRPDGTQEGGGLQRAVKKLIHDSQVSPSGTHNTPTSSSSQISGLSPPLRNDGTFQPQTGGMPNSYMDLFAPTTSGAAYNNYFPMDVSAAAGPSNVNPQNLGGLSYANYGTASAPAVPVAGSSNEPQTEQSLESMLQAYMPPQNQAAVPGGPDDFLNRVFNFNWDGQGEGTQNGNQDYANAGNFFNNGWMG